MLAINFQLVLIINFSIFVEFNFDQDGRTPLLMAIQGAYEDVVKLLLERGAKVNIADISKKYVLLSNYHWLRLL